MVRARTAISVVIIWGGLALFAACTGKVQQVDRFAQAGVGFSNTVPALIDESFALSVEEDSQQLEDFRKVVSNKSQRLEQLETSNKELRQRLQVLRDFRRHSQILKAYFVALQQLAQSNAPSGAGEATGNLVTQLVALDPKIADAAIGGVTVRDALPPAVTIVVGSLQSRALQDELERNAQTIERELALTEAFLTTLQEIAQGEFDALQKADMRDTIDLPYIGAGALPRNWSEEREKFFKATLETPALERAKTAAAQLRTNYIALAEGQLSPASVTELVDEVAALIALVKTS